MTRQSKRSNQSMDSKRDEERTNEEKLDDVIEQLGGFGKFQTFAYFAVSTGINSVGFWFYSLAYLTQEPGYKCQLARG